MYPKESQDKYRKRILRFTFQFSLQDTVAREWFCKQSNKGAYLKALILQDKAAHKDEN